jgi:hypothetical protein
MAAAHATHFCFRSSIARRRGDEEDELTMLAASVGGEEERWPEKSMSICGEGMGLGSGSGGDCGREEGCDCGRKEELQMRGGRWYPIVI